MPLAVKFRAAVVLDLRSRGVIAHVRKLSLETRPPTLLRSASARFAEDVRVEFVDTDDAAMRHILCRIVISFHQLP